MIHPLAVIGPDVKIGNNVSIGPFTYIRGRTVIGDNTYIAANVVIGEEAEHSTDRYEFNQRNFRGWIVIGSNVVVREFTQICRPTKDETRIANNAYVAGRVYVAHDAQVEENTVLSNSACLGGWVRVMRGANLGMGVVAHQFSTIGQYAMIAANATVVKDIPPLAKYIPNKDLVPNTYAFDKWGFDWQGVGAENYLALKEEWQARRHEGRSEAQWPTSLS